MIKNKIIIVTGAAGFIGSHICDEFIENKYKIIGVDNLKNGNSKNLNKKIIFEKTDLNNQKDVQKLLKKYKPETIIHQASNLVDVDYSIQNPIQAYQDLIMTAGLINIGFENGLKHFIFASSANVYSYQNKSINENSERRPTSPYGLTKEAIENYIRYFSNRYKIKYTILRYFNVYGERQSSKSTAAIPTFIRQIHNEGEIILNGGDQTRDFVYVKDVARANYLSVVKGVEGIFNVGNGRSVNISDVANRIAKLMKKNPRISYLKRDSSDTKYSKASIAKIKRELKWKPQVELNEGLRRTIDYYTR